MSAIPTLRTETTDTSNNNIRVETPDMRLGEFGVPYAVINLMYAYVNLLCDVPETLKENLSNMGFTPLFVKKSIMAYKLITDSGDWTTKDVEVMTEVVSLMLYLFYVGRIKIESAMFGVVEKLEDEVASGKIKENEYKNTAEIIMRLKNLYKELEQFELGSHAKGRWAMMGEKKVLILKYKIKK